MMRLLILLAASALLAACTSTQAVLPRIDVIDRPALNTIAEAELGDTIVEKGRISTYDGLVLRNEVRWGDGFILKRYVIVPGRLRARQTDARHIYYYSENMTVYDALLGTQPFGGGGLCHPIAEPTQIRGFFMAGNCNMNMNPAPTVERARITDVDAPGFRQELIYNGRSGQTVRFLYREYSGDFMRPPFSQDVQYDLSEGNTIGFRGARVEIVEATNTNLRYRVLSSFPDPVP